MCGTEPLQNARFCHGCGSSVGRPEAAAEYKQVTVLFADVVHSMDIAAAVGAERLREITTQLVHHATAVVQRYSGTVDKFTGDGIMAVFGAPVALQGHPFRACLAALDLQTQAKQLAVDVKGRDGVDLQLRVGLNSGEVIAGEIGSGRWRLHRHWRTGRDGPADGIGGSAGRSDAQRAHRTARRSDRGARRTGVGLIKGAEQPVPARRLLGVAEHGAIVRRDTTLVGRQWELAAADRARTGPIGSRLRGGRRTGGASWRWQEPARR